MRTLKTTLLLLIIYSTPTIGQKDNVDFTITIDELVMLGSSKTVITKDSIITTSKNYLKKIRTPEFRRALTNDERGRLKRLLSKINLNKLNDSYVNNMIDDNYEFTFTFDINNKIKVTTIYGVRHADIFKLVEQINAMLPKDCAIHYNNEYLESFETNGR